MNFWVDLLAAMEAEQTGEDTPTIVAGMTIIDPTGTLDGWVITHVSGPEDEPDEEANGDPDSTIGDDDDMGFNEMVWWPEPLFAPDDGFDDDWDDEDAEDEEEEDDEEDDGEED